MTDVIELIMADHRRIHRLQPMCGSGVLPGGWRREAVADHEDIREAIGEATLQAVGSSLWWGAARAAIGAAGGDPGSD